ncbi:hypothetical protein MKZ38_007686 [Zalerion maritima]|uniref:Uncharacterized protein n=1 Tax=Zalerion maritima TaxID=339359 RepID=A0AAD5RHH3_9PEZI|nr:hypothetical protein MKZ38_007686 [Zalerion maritima]
MVISRSPPHPDPEDNLHERSSQGHTQAMEIVSQEAIRRLDEASDRLKHASSMYDLATERLEDGANCFDQASLRLVNVATTFEKKLNLSLKALETYTEAMKMIIDAFLDKMTNDRQITIHRETSIRHVDIRSSTRPITFDEYRRAVEQSRAAQIQETSPSAYY